MLTIDELKQLEKYDWVYVVLDDHEGYYMKGVEDDDEFVPSGVFSMGLSYSTYGIKWKAYKNKEEAEDKSITLPCKIGDMVYKPDLDSNRILVVI